MEFHRLCLFLHFLAIAEFASSQGPVFVNPNNAATAAFQTTSANPGDYVTQTVYGFLDFTTTIGNTVMVFSPQSAAVPDQTTPKPKQNVISNSIIESKTDDNKKVIEIKPSKPVGVVNKKSSEKKISSIVQVQSQASPVLSTKINFVEDKSSVQPHPPLVVSQVQVVGAPSSKVQTKQIVMSKVEVVEGPTHPSKKQQITANNVESHSKSPPAFNSKVIQVKSDDEPAIIMGNHIGEREYADFLSRQPSEVVEETYKVINLKPSSKFILKHRPSEIKKNINTKRAGAADHPTGLVTKLGGTVIRDGTTTVIETSVIGTYISGKYAQVLQSSSRKINPTQSLRILKTASPSLGKGSKLQQQHQQNQRHVELTASGSVNEEASLPVEGLFNAQNSIKSTRKPSGNTFKRFKNRHKETDVSSEERDQDPTQQPHSNYKKSQKNRTQSQSARKHNTSTTQRPQKANRKRKSSTTKPSVHSEEVTSSSSSGKRFSGRKNKQSRPSTSSTSSNESSGSSYTRRGFKPKVQPSTVEVGTTSSSLYKFKLNRTPGRWQYKTTSKPRVTIRKQNPDDNPTSSANETLGATSPSSPTSQEISQALVNEIVTPQARSDDVDSLEGSESIASIIDDESSTENKVDSPVFPIETIKVEISTPPDFTDVYFEIATIKSPYTFQVGSVKNTRYITVTSTFKKLLEPSTDPTPTKLAEPLTENILATTSNYAKDNNFLDSSIATLPPIYLASDVETPPLETLTETFSTTQTMLKTHILPVVRFGNDTISSTLVQTYVITRMVTATKTLPPMDAYHFNPSRTLNEFNSHLDEAGSELHLELEFGDSNEQDEGQMRKLLPADLDLANIGSNFDLSDVDKNKLMDAHLRSKKNQSPPKPTSIDQQSQGLNQDQLQQLALYRLLNPGAVQGQVITTSKPVIKVETVYETFILPVTQGHNTIQSTISKIKSTFTKTDYEFGTSTIAAALPLGLPQIPQQIQPVPQIPQLGHQIPQLAPQIPQLNPFAPQPQFAVTSSPVVQSTMITQTNSKILKLTFGAKTAQTTIFSTTVIPTLVTSYVTASLPVTPTAAYPGFFPAPFPGYPFVG